MGYALYPSSLLLGCRRLRRIWPCLNFGGGKLNWKGNVYALIGFAFPKDQISYARGAWLLAARCRTNPFSNVGLRQQQFIILFLLLLKLIFYFLDFKLLYRFLNFGFFEYLVIVLYLIFVQLYVVFLHSDQLFLLFDIVPVLHWIKMPAFACLIPYSYLFLVIEIIRSLPRSYAFIYLQPGFLIINSLLNLRLRFI